MKTVFPRIRRALGALVVFLVLSAHIPAGVLAAESNRAIPVHIQQNYGMLPLSFEANRGQAPLSVRYQARGPGYRIALEEAGVTLVMRPRIKADAMPMRTAQALLQPSTLSPSVVRMDFLGASPESWLEGLEGLSGTVNYLRDRSPASWQTEIPTFAKVRYWNLYPGVHLDFYGHQRQLEYDFVLEPGADVTAIGFSLSGADHVAIQEDGDLLIGLGDGELRMRKPLVYQIIDGQKRLVSGHYTLAPCQDEASAVHCRRVGFHVAAHDVAKPLVIDPVLSYSSYLGGFAGIAEDIGFGIRVDQQGNAWVVGQTRSPDFPRVAPIYGYPFGDESVAFLSKVNPSGTALLFSTLLPFDAAYAVTIDSAGHAYVAGVAGGEAVVTKVDSTGTFLHYLQVFGGSGLEWATAVAVDSGGNAYVTGLTSSMDFPTVSPLQPAHGGGTWDAFAVKVKADGSSFEYATYLGGNENEGFPEGGVTVGVAVDASGYAYVSGATASQNFPTVAPYQSVYGGGMLDVFVSKLNPAGSALVYSTYLGGSNYEYPGGIAVDSAGNVSVTGGTASTDFPTVNPIQPSHGGNVDVFVTRLNATGSALLFSTFYGGNGFDFGQSIALNSSGHIHITGTAESANLPTVDPLQPPFATYAGLNDAFVAKLRTNSPALLFGTHLGGSSTDWGYGIAVDQAGAVYVTGWTRSLNFPTVYPLQANYPGGITVDAFVSKIVLSNPNSAPVCQSAQAQPASFWAPNHQLQPVSILNVTDPDGDPVTIAVTSVTQDEPVNGQGDGDTSPDAVVVGSSLQLRAERSGKGDGRVYTVHFTATDSGGESCSGAVTVTVPHSVKRFPVVDSGQLYNSLLP